jgi:hypothetical protein
VNVAIALAAAGAVALLALHPAPLLQVFPRYGFVARHMPDRQFDGPDPIYFHFGYRSPAKIDTAAIRRGGELIPDDGVYYFRTGVADQTSENLMLAARLFFFRPCKRARRRLQTGSSPIARAVRLAWSERCTGGIPICA